MSNITRLFDLYRYISFIDYDLQLIEEDEILGDDNLLDADYEQLNNDLYMLNYYMNQN